MVELSVVAADETRWQQVSRAIDAAFFVPVSEDESSRDHLRPVNRRFALMSDQQVVGGGCAYVFDLTLPGGAKVPAAGLAGVGILPTAQGQGGLHLLMDMHLRNSKEQGDAVSVLMASESGLYSRFGYGAATEWAQYQLDTRSFCLRHPLADAGSFELLDDEAEARAVCAQIHASQQGAGELSRSEGWWREVIRQDKRSWLGGGAQFVVVHRDHHGQADAYALYTIEDIKPVNDISDGNQRARCRLRELMGTNVEAQAATLQYLCKIAWVRELRWELAPVDPPIKQLMQDPRQLAQISRCDMLWLRVLDMPRLLQQRRYFDSVVVEFNYIDELFPELSGGFRLTTNAGDTGQSYVEPIDAESADRLRFGPEQLARVLLGGIRVISLYHLGQITGPEADVRRLDKLLLTDFAPFNLSKF